jgi:hypothetical protein
MLMLASCTTYQYVTLDSPQIQKNDKREFVWENDTLRLTYNFHGKNGPLNLTVLNKTDQPLYIDWKRSALIRDGQSLSLFDNTVLLSGNLSTSTYRVSRGISGSNSSLSATFDLPQGTQMVAPHAYVSKGLLDVQDPDTKNLAFTGDAQQETKEENGVSSKFTRVSYPETGSPVHFSVYLSFALGNDLTKLFALRHSFYASEVILSHDAPDYFVLYKPEPDQLYIEGSTE